MGGKMKRIKITEGTILAIEGNLYEVYREDSILHVFDWFIQVQTANQTWVLRGPAVKGFVIGPEGFKFANRSHRDQLEAFIQHMENVGSINPALWDKVAPDWKAQRLAVDRALDLRDERAERAAFGQGVLS